MHQRLRFSDSNLGQDRLAGRMVLGLHDPCVDVLTVYGYDSILTFVKHDHK